MKPRHPVKCAVCGEPLTLEEYKRGDDICDGCGELIKDEVCDFVPDWVTEDLNVRTES